MILDIRMSSVTYSKYLAIDLIQNKNALIIPTGVAHGFVSLKNNTTIVYCQTSPYKKSHDKGIRWDSFGYKWEVQQPIISKRDKLFKPFEDFSSPFI